MPEKLETNEDLVVRLMNFNPTGALCQAFIIEAIRRYAEQCSTEPAATFHSAFLNGAAWVKCAQHIKAECDKFYGHPYMGSVGK